ncbi:MAG: SurA N-terminal domain-containing protein [Alphaproteobacteria bacterium]
MLTSFRKATKSTVGTIVIALIGLFIIIGFAMGDIQSLSLGNAGMGSSTLAKAGSIEITDREMSDAMQRRLAQVRQENPEADYASLARDFDPILEELINQKALEAFAKKHGFVLSKRLVDAEIANIPNARGLDGRFSEQSYQAFLARQRLTDAEVRAIISGGLLQRLLMIPGASNARVPVGIATPYASMLLEERQGDVALIPLAPIEARLKPTAAQLQQFYSKNRNRYMVPEQRALRLARIGPERLSNVTASDQEIEAYYKANQAAFGAKDIKVISQAVVPDRNVANQIAQRARGGQSFVDAVKPAGLSAADISVGPQTRQEFASLAGEKVATETFKAGVGAGAVVGPVQSELGWHVVKVDSVRSQPGKSLAAARAEIATKLTEEKRKQALADLVDKVQDALDGGSNFAEAVRIANLQVTTTPLVTASGVARDNPSYKFPDELAPALKSGFELSPTDDPVLEQVSEEVFVLVAPVRVVAAAPAPFPTVRAQVERDWKRTEASRQARALAESIAAKARGGTSLADAVKQSNASLPPVQSASARRIQLTQMGGNVPAPLRAIFTTAAGRTQVGADNEGRGYFVVKVNKIVPGNALNRPALIGQVQTEFAQPLSQEYAQQLLGAIREEVGVKRNEAAIAAARKRMAGGS